MTGPDRRQTEGVEPRPDPGSAPYFPGMRGRPGSTPPRGTPLPAPPAPSAGTPPAAGASQATAVPMTMHGSPGDVTVAVEGRITVDDAVLEKIAALAALEVAGVAGPSPAGTRVSSDDEEATVDLAIAVEYGCVIKDVAQAVQANVARVIGLMLGTRVAAVNVSVADVRMPAAPPRPRAGGDQTARA